MAREGAVKAEARVPAAAALLPHITDANLRSLMVYRVGQGWVADLVLVDLPGGTPNRVGIPERAALSTEQEAVDAGFELLVGLLAASELPTFEIYGASATLSRGTLDHIRNAAPGRPKSYGSVEAARERIRMMVEELMPEGFTLERCNALPEQQRGHFMAVLHLAALSGLVFYP